MLPKQIGILLALGTLIAACGVPTTRTNFVDDYEVIATEIGRGDCYVIPGVDEWTVIDDHHVYIRASKSALERESGADSAEGPVVVSTVESRSRVEEGSLIDFILRRESAVIEDVP